jgi:hypothetical protein
LVVVMLQSSQAGTACLVGQGLVEGWGVPLCLEGMVVVSWGHRLRQQSVRDFVQHRQTA